MTGTVFENRRDSGKKLARELSAFAGRQDVLVLGLPRGGIKVAFEVAQALGAPLDVFMVRKVGVPSSPEVALGAIASGGVQVVDDELVQVLGLPAQTVARLIAREQREFGRRERLYRERCAALPITGRAVILVDDGAATGSTMSAALKALRLRRPARMVAAIPVGAKSTCSKLRRQADELVCLVEPAMFLSVGEWYQDFRQVSDREVRKLLRRGRESKIVAAAEPGSNALRPGVGAA